ncbi:hypothetical protein [Flavobacterium sp.]|uniref:hypothetical protein n=1 Tax=Flavobacterium sp. TaxID=239 RepID=UPI00286CB8C7|nr:hypothetical protein [Flavobacterium sp.]
MISSSEDTGKLFSNLVGFGRFIDIKEKLDKISRTQNLNTDFGKNTRENRIRENNQEISKLKNEIKNKLDEIGIKQVTFNEKEIFNKIKLFTSKLSGEKVKAVTVKSDIDFDLLIKTKIGTTYEDDALRLNSEKENLEKVKSLNISLRKFSKKSINTLSKKLNAAYSQIESPIDIVLGKLFDNAINSYETIIDFDRNTCVLCNTNDLGNEQKSFYDKINDKIRAYNKFKVKYELFFQDFLSQIKYSKVIEFENSILSINTFFLIV